MGSKKLLITGAVIAVVGPAIVRAAVPIDRIPVYVRAAAWPELRAVFA